MTVTAVYELKLSVAETFTLPASSRPIINYDNYNDVGTLNSTSTPPITKVASFAKALTAGAATLDLTALPGLGTTTVDGTGLKVQAVKIQVPSTNVNPLIIVPGASNGIDLFGATFKITLYPGEIFEWIGYNHASRPDVAAADKTIDLSDGTTGTESCNWTIVFG